MLKRLMICLVISNGNPFVLADESPEFEAFLEKQKQEIAAFEQQHDEEFESFVRRWRETEEAYRSEVAKHWSDPELSGKSRLIQYSDDLDQRTIVDYQANTITVELNDSQSDEAVRAAFSEQLGKLGEASVADAASRDPVLINAGVDVRSSGRNQNQSRKLVPQISAMNQKTRESVAVTRNNGKVSASVKMPNRSTLERAGQLLPLARVNGQKWGVPPALILAIIHTESSFNPLARSHIPAFGLMQIVPVSAGRDVTQELYGSQRLLTPDYLYNSEQNVEAGSVYLSLLLHRYFKEVADDESRFYMAVASYNTGPGNVSRAMSNTTLLAAATREANQLSPAQVYQRLQNNLPADETKQYLKKVTQRYDVYQNHLETQL